MQARRYFRAESSAFLFAEPWRTIGGTFSGAFTSGGSIGPERILDKVLGTVDDARLIEICEPVRANLHRAFEFASGRLTPSTPVMLVLARRQ
jgi:hypothetical protein